MKCYLAARYSRRLEIAQRARELATYGIEVQSRWLLGTHEAVDGDSSKWCLFAQDDVDDIHDSDLLIAFTENNRTSRGGRHVELGIALGLGIKIIVIGPCENVFCALPEILRFNSWEQFAAKFLTEFLLQHQADMTADADSQLADAGQQE